MGKFPYEGAAFGNARVCLNTSAARSLRGGVTIMKKSTISAIALCAILTSCLTIQSCADTSSQTTTTYTRAPDGSPEETNTTTTTTTNNQDSVVGHDSVVGSTFNAVGTIIAAPFRLIGDAISIIL
jgi:hypothetical protein